MKNIRTLKILLMSVVLGLSACSSLNSSVGSYFGMDTDLQVDFVTSPNINPDESGKASPVYIRMYELKTPKMMKQADFIDIYERDKEALGEDMIAVHKLPSFKPGEKRTEHYVLDKKTNYVAFFAEFQNYKDAKYRAIVPVVAHNVVQSYAKIQVTGDKISFVSK